MKIWTRAATNADRERFIWIESGAMPGLSYVNDVWEMFTTGKGGEFSAALLGDELGGIGKLTRLYGSYAWLETLRVHPAYQGKGLGKAIYDRYMEQMAQMQLSAVGMYTNYDNIVSRALAEKYGLTVQERFSEYIKTDLPKPNVNLNDMQSISENNAENIFTEHLGKLPSNPPKFIVVNRTFYPVKSGLAKMLTANGWLYICDYGIIVMGCRFQPHKALHIAFMQGNKAKLLEFACAKAASIGTGTISAMRVYNDYEEGDFLTHHGFTKSETDYITLWKGL